MILDSNRPRTYIYVIQKLISIQFKFFQSFFSWYINAIDSSNLQNHRICIWFHSIYEMNIISCMCLSSQKQFSIFKCIARDSVFFFLQFCLLRATDVEMSWSICENKRNWRKTKEHKNRKFVSFVIHILLLEWL